ncbi:hypothetical protein Avbf_01556, partial [Armadillidium vulgare]
NRLNPGDDNGPPPEMGGNLAGFPDENLPQGYSLSSRTLQETLNGEETSLSKDLLKSLLGDNETSESEDNIHHLGVQLAEAKGHLRRLRQD